MRLAAHPGVTDPTLTAESGSNVYAKTVGPLEAVTSPHVGGAYHIHASFSAHPDHYTDDDAMLMLCRPGARASGSWRATAGCVKFLLWDEYTIYYKRLIGEHEDASISTRRSVQKVLSAAWEGMRWCTDVSFDVVSSPSSSLPGLASTAAAASSLNSAASPAIQQRTVRGGEGSSV